jgi:signal transduction histidine kinase
VRFSRLRRARHGGQAFTRCLNNLIDNAVKYAGSAELQSGVEGEELVIRVLDEGPGIPHDLIGEAFQPYRRLGNGSGKPRGPASA